MNHCICCNLVSKTNIAFYCGSCVLQVERFSSVHPILSYKLQGINAVSQTGMQCLLEHLCSWQVVISFQQVLVKIFTLAFKTGYFLIFNLYLGRCHSQTGDSILVKCGCGFWFAGRSFLQCVSSRAAGCAGQAQETQTESAVG